MTGNECNFFERCKDSGRQEKARECVREFTVLGKGIERIAT
ncbi:MAG: hypothetical protein ACE5IO_05405 [Thermoplasmata archaeon]